MSFKDQIKQDLSDIFLNLDEFADLHRIEGKEVPVVIDSDIMAKLSKIGDNRIHGMDEADMVIMGKPPTFQKIWIPAAFSIWTAAR